MPTMQGVLNNRAWRVLFAFPMIIVAILIFQTYWNNRAAARHQKTAQSLILAHDAANHNTYRYRFDVNERRYEGTSSASTELSVGDRPPVYYDARDPSWNSLEPFDSNRNDWGEIVLGVGFCAIVLYCILQKNTTAPRASRHRSAE